MRKLSVSECVYCIYDAFYLAKQYFRSRNERKRIPVKKGRWNSIPKTTCKPCHVADSSNHWASLSKDKAATESQNFPFFSAADHELELELIASNALDELVPGIGGFWSIMYEWLRFRHVKFMISFAISVRTGTVHLSFTNPSLQQKRISLFCCEPPPHPVFHKIPFSTNICCMTT